MLRALRRSRRHRRTALALLVAATLASGVLAIAWASSYERAFTVTAQTQVLELEVAPGPPLEWLVGAVSVDCARPRDPARAGAGPDLLLSAGARVRLYPVESPGGAPFWVLGLYPVASGEPVAAAVAQRGAGGQAGAALALPATVCLDPSQVRLGLVLPLRGALGVGASVRAQQRALLLQGRVVLDQAPPRWPMAAALAANYRFEADRAELELGDKVVLPPPAPCVPARIDCPQTQGFVHLSAPEPDKPLALSVRATSPAEAVDIERPGRPLQRLQPSWVKAVTNDRVLALLLSLTAFLAGVTLRMLQRLALPGRGGE